MHCITSFLLLAFASLGVSAHNSTHCRCRPADPCWPNRSQWQQLNTTIHGRLQAVRPVAAVCHNPTYDAAACEAVNSTYHDSLWRAGQPGAVQWANYEARPAKNESCYLDTDRSVPCGQGRVSLYSAVAKSEADVQAAVRFAKKHNLRLAIKNTGHCFLGRSTAPESLQIATHAMDSIKFVDSFVPEGGCASEGPAVTIGAGVWLKPLYEAVAEHNRTVTVGFSHTVGAAGGYIQGGGHSPLGPWKGMGADNALEFRVVNAEGHVIVANSYKNTDLFWALRGGGGGTFGVVTSVTIRTFPEIPLISVGMNLTTTNATAFWEAATAFHSHLPSINEAGGSGYYWLMPQSLSGNGEMTVVTGLFFANKTDVADVDKTMEAVRKRWVDLAGNESVEYSPTFIPESKYLFQVSLNQSSDETGSISRLGSRLISRDFLLSDDGPGLLSRALQNVTSQLPFVTVIGHMVAGGAVSRNTSDTAINPAWRRTATHIVVGSGWLPTTPIDVQNLIISQITDKMVPVLKALEPDMGAYLNEADANEADFQQSFWGSNYGRLLQVKKRWDPSALFITNRGVGSEEWDEDGLCRIGH